MDGIYEWIIVGYFDATHSSKAQARAKASETELQLGAGVLQMLRAALGGLVAIGQRARRRPEEEHAAHQDAEGFTRHHGSRRWRLCWRGPVVGMRKRESGSGRFAPRVLSR